MRRIREAGFTLIELLICVAILGILATLAMPRVSAAVEAARQAQVHADLKLIQTALSQHFLDLGYYPVKLNDLKDRGYLPPRVTLKSPVSGHWYFYAVDDNRTPRSPRAFVLGAPPKNAGDEMHLYHGKPLPRGKKPSERATAWYDNNSSTDPLNLYTDDDSALLPAGRVPYDLSDYRNSCKPDAAALCDLWTN